MTPEIKKMKSEMKMKTKWTPYIKPDRRRIGKMNRLITGGLTGMETKGSRFVYKTLIQYK